MKFSSKYLENAVNAFARLPGIGKKTALRTVLHLLQKDQAASSDIVRALTSAQNSICTCNICHNLADQEICEICSDPHRRKDVICVVENVRDVMAIEDTGQFAGKYHILGGVISPIDGIGPEDLNIDSLLKRVADGTVTEFIMGVSPTIEGETTIFYIAKMLSETPVKVSIIARGVSFGGELEYADELTLGRSIAARTPYIVRND